LPCDVALPCATQNELLGEDAKLLVANGCRAVSEGANMPTDLDGVHIFKAAKLLYAPGKASNAGGVAVSGLEMSQNSERRSWKEDELQQMLKDIMPASTHPASSMAIRGRLYRLCEGREYRGLQEGGRRDAGVWGGVRRCDGWMKANGQGDAGL
jgi:glutamate dehydrogenase/leucine dehydrogenase